MNRRNALWALLVGTPVALGATFAVVQTTGAAVKVTGPCCEPDCCPPGCCDESAAAKPQEPTTECCTTSCRASAKK